MNLLRQYKKEQSVRKERKPRAKRRLTSSDRNLSRWGDIIQEVEQVQKKVDDRTKSSTNILRKPSREQVVVFDDPFKVS